MTEQPDQQETSPMSDVLEFPGQRAAGPASVAATAERLSEAEVDETEAAEAEVIDFPGAAQPVEDERDSADEQPGEQLVVRPERTGRLPEPLRRTGRATATVVRVSWRATASPRAHLAYISVGGRDVTTRLVHRLTHHDLTEAIRQAKADRDLATLAELEQVRRQAADSRWNRVKTQVEAAAKLSKMTAYGLAGVAGTLVVVSACVALAAGIAGIGELLPLVDRWDGGASWRSIWTNGYWAAISGTYATTATAVRTVWDWFWMLAPWMATAGAAGGFAALHRAGKRSERLPEWARPHEDGDDAPTALDEGSILGALRNLGIKGLNDAFKAGWGGPNHPARVWEQGLGRDGKGWRCQIQLPQAVPVSEVTRQKERLAHNLGRYPVEVWPSEPKASVLELWIADPGVLTGPVDPWPLLAELPSASVDYFSGVPVGITLKGDQITGQLAGANWAAAGMMGSGKSTLVITGLLGAMLDPLVDIDVFVMAQNGDYELMRSRLRTLQTGSGDEVVDACMSNLQALYAELDTRGKALAEHTAAGDTDAEKVTRRLAEKDSRLRPRIMVIDECQALFLHKEYGAEAERMAVQLMNASRKYAITLMFLTPEPSSTSLPRKLMSVMSNKACFAIGDQQSNDAILGTSAYRRGISAVGLEPATAETKGDVGTAMTSSGFLAKPGLLRSHYVPRDQHEAIVNRALQLREGVTAPAAPESSERDLLADVAEVLDGEQAVKAPDVVARLRKLAPTHRRYQNLDGTKLTEALKADYAVKPGAKDGYSVVRSSRVQAALAEREVDDDED